MRACLSASAFLLSKNITYKYENYFLFFLLSARSQSAPRTGHCCLGAGGNYTIASYPGNFTGYYDDFCGVPLQSQFSRSIHHERGGPWRKAIINTAGAALVSGDINLTRW